MNPRQLVAILVEDDSDDDLFYPADILGSAAPNTSEIQKQKRAKVLASQRGSHYAEAYLRGNTRRQEEGRKGITISSFLSYVLKGSAKKWSGRYAQSLKIDLDRRVDAGMATNAGGGTYYETDWEARDKHEEQEWERIKKENEDYVVTRDKMRNDRYSQDDPALGESRRWR